MRTSIRSLSLLLFVLPALSKRYHIRSSIVPSDCIVSTGEEEPGHPVITAHFDVHHGCSLNTVVDVHASISDTYSYGPVSGKSGLYIGRSEDGKYLEWAREPYEWEFSRGSFPQYHVVQIPEHDEFWVDPGKDKAVEIVGPGKGDVYWYFDEVHA